MFRKKLLIVALCVTAQSFALPSKFEGEQGSRHEKHRCFKGFKKGDICQFVEGADGKLTPQKVDNSRAEQVSSGLRVLGASALIGFIAEGHSKSKGDITPHLLGLLTNLAANLFIGGLVCQDRNILTQVGGGITGYIFGSYVRYAAK